MGPLVPRLSKSLSLVLCLVAAACGGYLASCSFRPLSATVIVKVSPPAGRPGPALSAMRFAVAISNGPPDSVTSINVQGRNRDCLKLRGLVAFPYTYDELRAGVQIPLALGSYHVAIVGYSDLTGSPTTIEEMFSGSSSLKSFLIAEDDYDTSASSNVVLTSTYDEVTTADLMASCPVPGSAGRITLAIVDDILKIGKNLDSTPSFTNILVEQSPQRPNLFVEESGTINLSYMVAAPSYQVRYAVDTGAGFVDELVHNHSELGPTAVARDEGGRLTVFYRDPADPTKANVRSKVGLGWGPEINVLDSALAFPYDKLELVPAAGNQLVATGISTTGAALIDVRIRDSLDNWGPLVSISNAGAVACDNAIDSYQTKTDSAGFVHIAYRCASASGTYLGYATNKSGSFTDVAISPGPLAFGMNQVALDIDSTGQLHILYTATNGLHYVTGSIALGTFSNDDVVLPQTDESVGITFRALGPSSLFVLFTSNGAEKYLFRILGTGWVLGPAIVSAVLGIELPTSMF